ncbi:MAG TPA: hypothetical protein VHT01_07505 [Candidatus Udaeobacter sp.]|jgi:hypothetical protein|nr:hypothetical protein [Candidatus Udaeobacter sp.]
MRRIAFYLLCVFEIQSLSYADVTKFARGNPSGSGLPAADRKTLEYSSRFREVHSTSDLPPAIVAICAGDKNNLAEPGGKWNATDVVIDPSLPSKRLIWAANGGDYYVVHYERGGIAHTFHILVTRLAKDDAKPKIVWSAMGGPFKDYTAFLQALRSRKLDDRLDWH